MAELADALDSGSSRGNPVQVQVLLSAPKILVLRNKDFLFKPIGLVYHHALACISLPYKCGAYYQTIGVYTSIGLMRYKGYTVDDIHGSPVI